MPVLAPAWSARASMIENSKRQLNRDTGLHPRKSARLSRYCVPNHAPLTPAQISTMRTLIRRAELKSKDSRGWSRGSLIWAILELKIPLIGSALEFVIFRDFKLQT
jgi:hypothetical protein